MKSKTSLCEQAGQVEQVSLMSQSSQQAWHPVHAWQGLLLAKTMGERSFRGSYVAIQPTLLKSARRFSMAFWHYGAQHATLCGHVSPIHCFACMCCRLQAIYRKYAHEACRLSAVA